MSNDTSPSKRQRHEDRITLDNESLQRVDGWIEQVTSAASGVTVSRRELVNWLIQKQSERLSLIDADELRARFFDDVRFLHQAVKELKTARKLGKDVALSEILGRLRTTSSTRQRSSRSRRSKHAADQQTTTLMTDAGVVSPTGKTEEPFNAL